jgi:hypothetical protein
MFVIKGSMTMTHEQLQSDDEFLTAFLDCRLDAKCFDHRAHVRLAWLVLNRYPLEAAVERICSGISRFAAHLGATQKYSRTMSEALVRLMAHGGAGTPEMTWDEFTRANSWLVSDIRGMLARHYSPERLDSLEARQRFVAPDRLPLPECRHQPHRH